MRLIALLSPLLRRRGRTVAAVIIVIFISVLYVEHVKRGSSDVAQGTSLIPHGKLWVWVYGMWWSTGVPLEKWQESVPPLSHSTEASSSITIPSSSSLSNVHACRNTETGRTLVADSDGNVCPRDMVDPISRCCRDDADINGASIGTQLTPSPWVSTRHSEDSSIKSQNAKMKSSHDTIYQCGEKGGCKYNRELPQTDESLGWCCPAYEYCISCCLASEHKEPLLSIRSRTLDRVLRTINNRFDMCIAMCRTSHKSVAHSNREYIDPSFKFCC